MLKHPVVLRCVWLLMGLHILNFSIDPPDVLPDSVKEDLSYNEIESFGELFLEDVLCIPNAVPEHDEQDNPDGFKFTAKNIVLYYQDVAQVTIPDDAPTLPAKTLFNLSLRDSRYTSPSIGMISPPPEA